MQLLTFTIGGETYAVESRRVVEVLPLVPARPIPQTPPSVRGVFTYRGALLPLLDLATLFGVRPPAERLSTRVIVVDGDRRRTGLIAEDVISICSDTNAAASLAPLDATRAPFLGRILRIDGRTVQLLEIDSLLPDEVPTPTPPAPDSALP
ncbi:MAG: chemotaxis protein CheW [Pirellulales bacterium]